MELQAEKCPEQEFRVPTTKTLRRDPRRIMPFLVGLSKLKNKGYSALTQTKLKNKPQKISSSTSNLTLFKGRKHIPDSKKKFIMYNIKKKINTMERSRKI